MLAEVVACGAFPWFSASSKQWLRVSQQVGGRYVVEGSPDQLCFLMKYRVKMFSRLADLVGMLAISGPAGGGKGTVLYEARLFGGDLDRRAAATSIFV